MRPKFGPMRRVLFALMAVLFATFLQVPGAAAESPGRSIPFKRLETVPAAARAQIPRGARSFLALTTTLGGQRCLLVGYRKESDDDATLLVFSGGRLTQKVGLPQFYFNADQKVAMLWFDPGRHEIPMLVIDRYDTQLLMVMFFGGPSGKAHAEYWQSPEAGSYSYNYSLGSVDAAGYRTLSVRYLEEGMEKEKTELRHWTGKEFKSKE